MLELGTDEITLVLQLAHSLKYLPVIYDWSKIAEDLIDKFEVLSDFKWVFGHRQPQENPPKGYKTAYQYGEHSFYLAVAYHPSQPNMGIVIKFSAQALDYYCEQRISTVYQFMQRVQYKDYRIRLSRIDFTADYIDEGIDVTEIYQTLMDKKVGIFREYTIKETGEKSLFRIPLKLEGYLKEQEVPTIYLGSVQSNSRLRIYDKKREQIERKGTKYDTAVKCTDWVRFEGVFRHEYAHQISDEMMKIWSNDEYSSLIALTLGQKYQFMFKDEKNNLIHTTYTEMLLQSNNSNFKLKAPSSRNFDLAKGITYAIYGCGAMNTLYKIKEIWGIDAVKYLLDYILEMLSMDIDNGGYVPNEDCIYWLRKNQADYKKTYSDFGIFYNDNLMPMFEEIRQRKSYVLTNNPPSV